MNQMAHPCPDALTSFAGKPERRMRMYLAANDLCIYVSAFFVAHLGFSLKGDTWRRMSTQSCFT